MKEFLDIAGLKTLLSELKTKLVGIFYQKPTSGIPKTDLASAVQQSLDKADSAYQKPTKGIEKADLEADVQESLEKADEALKDAKAYVDALSGSAGDGDLVDILVTSAGGKVTKVQVVEDGLVDALESKQETLVSGDNIKTINGKSILGSGNIEIEGGKQVYVFDISALGAADTYYIGAPTLIELRNAWYGGMPCYMYDGTYAHPIVIKEEGIGIAISGISVDAEGSALRVEVSLNDWNNLNPEMDVEVEIGASAYNVSTQFKTINGETITGSGNINITGGGGGDIDLSDYATKEELATKQDERIAMSLVPMGTAIPEKANLNTMDYVKVGKYYCSQNAIAKTVTNCPTSGAFSMDVYNPLSTTLDDETTSAYTYRLRVITEYNTGIKFVQHCYTNGTAGTWKYESWYVYPRSSFSLNSSKNDGTAALGSATKGVYLDSTGTFKAMTYTLGKSVPSDAVFTDKSVTAVGNHYAPEEDESAQINADSDEVTDLADSEGVQVVTGLKRDAKGHVVGVTSTALTATMKGGGGTSGGEANLVDGVLLNGKNIVDADKVAKIPLATSSADGAMSKEDKAKLDSTASALSGKQDTITDLATIRDGASKGATAYQKPTKGIEKADLEADVQNVLDSVGEIANKQIVNLVGEVEADYIEYGFVAADGTTDLPYIRLDGATEEKAGLMTSADKVALEGKQDIITDIDTIRAGASKGATALQTHQDISGKQDKLVSGTSIKTINGQSILGSGNITIEGGGGGASKRVIYVDSYYPAISLNWNEHTAVHYSDDDGIKTLEFSFAEPTDNGYNECSVEFDCVSDGFQLTAPADVCWVNNEIPQFKSYWHYQISISSFYNASMGMQHYYAICVGFPLSNE